MKVLILDIDDKLPNFALRKVEKFHFLRGDDVIWNMPILLQEADKVYASCIFSWNRDKAMNYLGLRNDVMLGGTGFDIERKLPDEIEMLKLNLNFGFTTRGCIRQCKFCVVPQKEGYINEYGDIYDIWDHCSKNIKLLDNNILGLPVHFERICKQLIKEDLRIDFNQGLDIRLVTPEIARLLAKLKFSRDISFSLDSIALADKYGQGMKCLQDVGVKLTRVTTFLLCGFDSTLDEDLERIEIIKGYGSRPFVMKFRSFNGASPKIKREPYELQELARWTNQPHGFYKVMSFADWLKAVKHGI